MASTLRTLTNTDADFYPLLGPFLARRDVARYVGGEIWDDDDKTWIVATSDDGHVLGFIGERTSGGLVHVESCYVVGDDPRMAGRLVRAAVKAVEPSPCVTIVRHEHVDAYRQVGFVVVSETANFSKLACRGQSVNPSLD